MTECSVPARHISEGAAPCPYRLKPCPNSLVLCPIYIAPCASEKNITYNCCFSVSRQLMNCKLLADLCPCFHRSPQLCPDLVSFACRIVPEFWSFTRRSHTRSKQFFVVCALNCAQILVVRALDCAQFLLHTALFPT